MVSPITFKHCHCAEGDIAVDFNYPYNSSLALQARMGPLTYGVVGEFTKVG
jgi:hypothetical protein